MVGSSGVGGGGALGREADQLCLFGLRMRHGGCEGESPELSQALRCQYPFSIEMFINIIVNSACSCKKQSEIPDHLAQQGKQSELLSGGLPQVLMSRRRTKTHPLWAPQGTWPWLCSVSSGRWWRCLIRTTGDAPWKVKC